MSPMAVESLHPRTGGLPRPGSAGYGAGGLLPLESGIQAGAVFAGVRGLDAEVAAVAAKREQEKQWKATFRRDKAAVQRRLAALGLKDAQKQPNYRAIEQARRAEERERFESEKAAVKRRLAALGSRPRGTAAALGTAALIVETQAVAQAQAGFEAAKTALDAG
jgi:hypothetical protein